MVVNEELQNEASFILHFYKPSMKGDGRGHLWYKRYRGSMDARHPDSPSRYNNS